MIYQNDDKKSAIMQIQELLRVIQISNGIRPTVPIDGIFSTNTRDAVIEFQAQNSLPQTGTVDKTTYDLLYEKALEAEFIQSDPLPIYIFPKGQSVKKGEKSDFVMLLQIIINALTVAYEDFEIMEIDGTFGDELENAITIFQKRNNINQTGIVDKATWNALVTNFNKHNQNQ